MYKTNALHTYGNKIIKEYEHTLPDLSTGKVLVRAVMAAIGRPEIDQYLGNISTPFGQFGKQGLGQIVEFGPGVSEYWKPGDFISAKTGLAFSDQYVVDTDDMVKVPEANPKYIIEPIATAVHCAKQAIIHGRTTGLWPGQKMAIVGSGFLANIAAQYLISCQAKPNLDFVVLGKHNIDIWNAIGVKLEALNDNDDHYSAVINFHPSKNAYLAIQNKIKTGSYIVSPVSYKELDNFLMVDKALTCINVSTSSNEYHRTMIDSVNMIQNGIIQVDWAYSKSYNRKTEYEQAFSDAVDRDLNYHRGFIYW